MNLIEEQAVATGENHVEQTQSEVSYQNGNPP